MNDSEKNTKESGKSMKKRSSQESGYDTPPLKKSRNVASEATEQVEIYENANLQQGLSDIGSDVLSPQVDSNNFQPTPSKTPLASSNSEPLLSRKNVCPKNDFFMYVAILASKRSKDPSMQVGACLVDAERKHILGVGYNGAPNHLKEEDFPWEHVEKNDNGAVVHKCKNDFVIHAEANALILSDRTKHQNSIIYCTHYPCVACLKTMIHSGVKELYYIDDSRKDEPEYTASCRLLAHANKENVLKSDKLSPSLPYTLSFSVGRDAAQCGQASLKN